MNLYDRRAVDLLKAAIAAELAEKERRDARIAELEPLVAEHESLVCARTNERAGKTSISGLRTQLAFALLYREMGPPADGLSAPMHLPMLYLNST